MKLLYIINTLAIHGGVERVLTDKVNWLVEYANYDICLLIVNQGALPIIFPLNPKVKICDLDIRLYKIYQFPFWKRYFRLYQLRRLFRSRISEKIRIFSPDIIVCSRMDYICDVMKVRGDIPVVYESHNSMLFYKYENYSWIKRLKVKMWHKALKKVDMIVALTHGDALEWKKRYTHVSVIPNVVHLNSTGRYCDSSSKSVIFVGRYTYQKDYSSLLQIWKYVHNKFPDWQLHILGGYGGQQEELKDKICKEDNIVVHQPSSSINDEYLKCSLLLMTSLYEPFGLVLPEAMSCGLPVVAFDCPYGPADIITDGVDGFLIRDRCAESYISRVLQLITDKELRYKMGQAGIKSSQRYTADVIMPHWEKLFNELMYKYE